MPESRSLYATIIHLIVQLTILAIINWLLTELPMVRAISIPGLPVTIPAVISLAIGIIMIVIFLAFRQDFVPKLRLRYPGFLDLSAMVSDTVSLAVIIVAYTSFDDVIKPFMKEYSWAYAPIFLAIASWPLITLITTLYRSPGPVADWTSTNISPHTTSRTTPASSCASCGGTSPAGAKFCIKCGAGLNHSKTDTVKCASCGAVNQCSAGFCMKCGAAIEEGAQYDTRVAI